MKARSKAWLTPVMESMLAMKLLLRELLGISQDHALETELAILLRLIMGPLGK